MEQTTHALTDDEYAQALAEPPVALCPVTWPGTHHTHHCDDEAGHGGRHYCAQPDCKSWTPPRPPYDSELGTWQALHAERFTPTRDWWWHHT